MFGTLSGYGISFGSRVVLADVNLTLPDMGVLVLMGPGGEGKSTLVRTLAGIHASVPDFHAWGVCELDSTPALVRQKAQLVLSSVHENLATGLPNRGELTRAEQAERFREHLERAGLAELMTELGLDVSALPDGMRRALAVVRELLADPPFLMLDEPMANLPDVDALRIVELLRAESERRGILVVTHHQARARALGGEVALLAGGTVRERSETHRFLSDPQTPEGRSFVSSGRCRVPKPGAAPEDLADDSPPPTPIPTGANVPSHSVGPRGFRWVWPGRLGGTPRPGVAATLEWDLDALSRLGTTVLVNLEEDVHYDSAPLEGHGIELRHFPIVDMHAPSYEAAAEHCAHVERWIQNEHVVVLHCRAGLGRTGTLLAAQLIWAGRSAVDALETARRIEPKWIQSSSQEEFLLAFDKWKSATAEAAKRKVN